MNRKILGYIVTSVLAFVMCFEIVLGIPKNVSASENVLSYYVELPTSTPNSYFDVLITYYPTSNEQSLITYKDFGGGYQPGVIFVALNLSNQLTLPSGHGHMKIQYHKPDGSVSVRDEYDFDTSVNHNPPGFAFSISPENISNIVSTCPYLTMPYGSYDSIRVMAENNVYVFPSDIHPSDHGGGGGSFDFEDSEMNSGSSFVGIGYQQTTSKYSFTTNKIVTDSKTMFNSAQIAFRDNLGNVVTDPLSSGLYKRVVGSWEDDSDKERWILSLWFEESDGNLIPSVDFEMYGSRGNSVNVGIGTVTNDWSITSTNNYVVIPYSMGGTKITSSTFTIYTSSQDDVTGDSGYVPDVNNNGSTDNIISGGGNNSPTYILDGSNFDVAQFLNGQYMQGFIGILSSFFGFLPAWLWVLLGFSITAFTVMAIYKFIKG